MPQARRILADLSATGDDTSRVRLDPSLESHRALADEGLVGLALSNLIENAVRHSDGAAVTVRAARSRAALSVIVEDDGPGVPEAELTALTRRFRRGRGARGEGTGLGLSIADSAARRLGGRLELASRDGGGLRAALVLPDEPVQSVGSPGHDAQKAA
jgi:two-component system sensor histidine kinase QseC